MGWQGWRCEPARLVAIAQIVIALAVSFGLDLSVEQQGMLLALVALLAGETTRAFVSPARG